MSLALASYPKVKLSIDAFDMLAQGGRLDGLDRTELLDGDIYLMSPQYSQHAMAKAVFDHALLDWKRAHRPDLVVLTEVSVAMPPNDEPIPDVVLASRPRQRGAIPVATVLLLVEVADDSRDRDLDYKAGLYARQGVPEYWVVDLQHARVVCHAEPSAKGYRAVVSVPFGTALTSATLAGLSVTTDDLI